MARDKLDFQSGCCICGKPLVYETESRLRVCAVCGKEIKSNAACEDGHFVCDSCHSSGFVGIRGFLKYSTETDPDRLFLEAVAHPGVHMHGPEHHCIVPWVLLTAYRNNGGRLSVPYDDAMEEAYQRGSQVPGGICGFWGTCGAAIGAGIYASLLLGSAPLNGEIWPVPQTLTAACLEKIASVGGPRCCKRDSRLAIEAAVGFTAQQARIRMPLRKTGESCGFSEMNAQCRKGGCPYYKRKCVSEEKMVGICRKM